MDLGLAGSTAVVTGGSKGMGLAIATTLAEEGAKVAVMARGAEALEKRRRSCAMREPRMPSESASTCRMPSRSPPVSRPSAEVG